MADHPYHSVISEPNIGHQGTPDIPEIQQSETSTLTPTPKHNQKGTKRPWSSALKYAPLPDPVRLYCNHFYKI